jgi:hypothetical protein
LSRKSISCRNKKYQKEDQYPAKYYCPFHRSEKFSNFYSLPFFTPQPPKGGLFYHEDILTDESVFIPLLGDDREAVRGFPNSHQPSS